MSRSFGQGGELCVEAELCQLGDKALDLDVLRTAVEVVCTKVLVLCAVFKHVVDRGEH